MCAQPLLGWQLSWVQSLPSSQEIALPVQPLSVQTAPVTQTFCGSHALPDASGSCLHTAVLLSHWSLVHGSPSLQFLTVPTHAPVAQESFWVQAFPSLHAPPNPL